MGKHVHLIDRLTSELFHGIQVQTGCAVWICHCTKRRDCVKVTH